MPSTPVVVLDDTLTDIADAIRSKNGSSDTYKPGEMAAAIGSLPTPAVTLYPAGVSFRGIPGAQVIKNNATVSLDNLSTLKDMFNGDTGVTSVVFDDVDLANVTDCSDAFKNCTNLVSVDFGNSHTGDWGGNAQSMFNYCVALTSVTFPASFKPTGCYGIFQSCGALREIPHFDTSSVTRATQAFATGGSAPAAITTVYDFSSVTTGYDISGVFGQYGRYDYGNTVTQTSVDNILQTMLTMTGLPANSKTFSTVFSNFTPSSTGDTASRRMYDLITGSQYYQAILDAGWTALT